VIEVHGTSSSEQSILDSGGAIAALARCLLERTIQAIAAGEQRIGHARRTPLDAGIESPEALGAEHRGLDLSSRHGSTAGPALVLDAWTVLAVGKNRDRSHENKKSLARSCNIGL
jgi:hypothetical protein